MEEHVRKDRSGWTLEKFDNFEDAEKDTRAKWHAASSEERFQAASIIKEIVYGKSAANARIQRVLTLVSQP